ncbi:MAG: hypothetical protein II379_05915 [Oscillospiraceae bacterium]|nr:hypothetical protein [Oscillospiraceae bacterium]
MRLLQDGAVAALSAIGLACVLWMLLSAVLHPRRHSTLETIALVPAGGAAAELEHTVRMLERSRYERGGFTRIIILDCGMDEETRRLAELLCRDDYDVSLCQRVALLSELG